MIGRVEARATIPVWRPVLILGLAACYGVVLLLAGGAGNAAGARDHWLLSVSWPQAATQTSDGGPVVTSSGSRSETAAPSAAPATVPTLLTPVIAATPSPSPSMALTEAQAPANPEPAGDPPPALGAATPVTRPGPPSLFNGSAHRAEKPKSPKGAGGEGKGGGKPSK